MFCNYFCLSDEEDFIDQAEITQVFAEDVDIPNTICSDITTADDDILEGIHGFAVSIANIAPQNLASISMPTELEIIINDNDGIKAIELYRSCL